LRKGVLAGILLSLVLSQALAEEICPDAEAFIADGWQHETVQDAMDDYLRDHRMRANWEKQPVPPDAIGRDYYEWLWFNEFGATMKHELVLYFCGDNLPAI
jgi:hypothetical protein